MGVFRFLLALSVLIIHSSPIFGLTLIPGYLAVRSFYMISGFLMALIIVEKYQYTTRPYYLFISNRVLRIYPLYLIVIILTILLSVVFGIFLGSYGKLETYETLYTLNSQNLSALFLIFLTNLTMFGQDIITFFHLDSSKGTLDFSGLQADITLQELLFIPIAWTVAVEFIFYLVAPFIIGRNKFVPLILLAGVLLFRILLYAFGVSGSFFIYRFAPIELFWFLLGIITYQLYKNRWVISTKYAVPLLTILILLMLAYKKIGTEGIDILFYTLVFLSVPALFVKFSKNKIDKYFGDLCYPIYISHCLFLLIVDANRFPKPWGKGLPLLVLTLLFSVAINKFVLTPLEKYRMNRIKVTKGKL